MAITDTLSWSKPRTYGNSPPPCRAHSSTLVEREVDVPGKKSSHIYVFGGGDGPNYSNALYILDAGKSSFVDSLNIDDS